MRWPLNRDRLRRWSSRRRVRRTVAAASRVVPIDDAVLVAEPFVVGDGRRVRLAPVSAVNRSGRVLDGRRSVRHGGRVHVSALASTLLAAHRVLSFAEVDDGYVRTWRPAPSAGGRHPIELLVSSRVDGLDDGSWLFDPLLGELVASDVLTARADRTVLDLVGVPEDTTVIFLMADFQRTLARYRRGESLVWRDSGALAATLQLAACGAGLSSCIAGTAGLIGDVNGRFDVGAVVVGPGLSERPSSPTA